MPRALITGVRGQDGHYLSEQLLADGWEVVGLSRPLDDQPGSMLPEGLLLVHGDVTKAADVSRLVSEYRPDAVFHLAAQSSVKRSFENVAETFRVNVEGTANVLEAVRESAPEARVLFAASASMYGAGRAEVIDETAALEPADPYGVTKVSGYFLARHYRQCRGMFVATAILFHHESPRRPPEFVSRKISRAAARIKLGLQTGLSLGNLSIRRDWGFAGDFVHCARLILEHREPADFVVATGETHSIADLCEIAFARVGLDYRDHVTSDERFARPNEKPTWRGDPTKARRLLGWHPRVDFRGLVEMMVDHDLAAEDRSEPAELPEGGEGGRSKAVAG